MNTFTLLTVLGALGTIASFLSGITAMRRHGRVGHRSSSEWMMWRVIFQTSTFLTILAAPLSR